MNTLATILRYELILLLTALALVVGYRLLTHQINVKGLLMDKTSGRAISPGRLQMLIATLSIAGYYLMMVVDTNDKTRLPELPNEYVAALGASNSIYLLGKLYGRFATTLGFASPKVRERAKPKEREMNK
jgi:hypothetical protein